MKQEEQNNNKKDKIVMIINYLPSAPEHPSSVGQLVFYWKVCQYFGGPLNDGVLEEVGKFN